MMSIKFRLQPGGWFKFGIFNPCGNKLLTNYYQHVNQNQDYVTDAANLWY